MNATPHTTLGYTSLKLIGVNPLGCLVAIGTHFLADYIGERGLYTDKQRIIYDVLPTLIAFVFAYFFGGENEVWLLLLGSVLGNLPDLIDKKLYLSIFLPKKFIITSVSLLIVVGGVLFLFSNKALKDLLKSIVTSKGETLSKTIDPDREKPDTRG
jgi:hypothetical protein